MSFDDDADRMLKDPNSNPWLEHPQTPLFRSRILTHPTILRYYCRREPHPSEEEMKTAFEDCRRGLMESVLWRTAFTEKICVVADSHALMGEVCATLFSRRQ